MQTLVDISINLLSDLLSWVIVGLTLAVFALGGSARQRRKLFDFFGISTKSPSIRVYISRMNVKPGGASMVGGEEWPSFQGPVVSAREFIILPAIDRLFRSPVLDNLPSSARSWLSSRFRSLQNIEFNLEPSPMKESEIVGGTIILLGSRLVNIGSRYYQDKEALTIVNFDNEKHELVVTRGSLKGMLIKASSNSISIDGGDRPANDLAVIERLYDRDKNRTVVIVAGTGSNGTMAATQYLVNHWQNLYTRFGRFDKQNFAVVVECPNRRIAEKGYQFPIARGEFTA